MLPKSIKSHKSITTDSAIEIIQWPESLLLHSKVLAIQTTRMHPNNHLGVDPSNYQHFNLGLHVGDCEEKVNKNRRYLQKLLPENTKIQWFEQIHGSDVAQVTQVSQSAIVADAAVTRNKNVCLAIMTADCLPILLVSKSGDEIAAIHGGWRPLAANIISKTLEKMLTPRAEIYAWLGPCISKIAFEVGNEVKENFIQQNEIFNTAFIKQSNGRYLANLQKIAKIQLELSGVKQISFLEECTYTQTDKYYSYRKHSTTGRMASLICIN